MSVPSGPQQPAAPPSGPRHLGGAVLGAVAVGGALGTLLRWALVAPAPESGSPVAQWITLGIVNLSGSFLLGVLSGYGSRRRLPRWLTAGLGVGVLGAYTSLSAVVLAATVAPAMGVGDYIQTGTPGGWLLVAGLAGTLLALAAGAALGTMAAVAGLRLGGFRVSSPTEGPPA